MMSGMFPAAKALAGATIGSAGDNADVPEAVLFKRMYRTDFSASEAAAISEHLTTMHARQAPRRPKRSDTSDPNAPVDIWIERWIPNPAAATDPQLEWPDQYKSVKEYTPRFEFHFGGAK